MIFTDWRPENVRLSISLAEEYLVRILCNQLCVSFDELRYAEYRRGKVFSTEDLLPSSDLIVPNIKRAYFVTYYWLNILNSNLIPLDPTNFGYKLEDGYFKLEVPEKMYPSVSDLPPPCTCLKCSRATCKCVENMVPCIDLCRCKINNSCTRQA